MFRAGKTDRGVIRKSNEDSIFFDEQLFIVADGMGGHLAGEIASQDAITCIKDFLQKNQGQDILQLITESVKYANGHIYKKAQTREEYKGMGTTVTLAKLAGEELFYAHVGDSRLYVFRSDELIKVTSDHSLVAQLLEVGQITPEQAQSHPNKNIITKAVGAAEDIVPDTGSFTLQKGDIVLLCSDGLTNMLSHYEIARLLKLNQADLEKLVEELIESAKQSGGTDNISVVCFKY